MGHRRLRRNHPVGHFLFAILGGSLLGVLQSSGDGVFMLSSYLRVLGCLSKRSASSRRFSRRRIRVVHDTMRRLSPREGGVFSVGVSKGCSGRRVTGELGLSVGAVGFRCDRSLGRVGGLIHRHTVVLLVWLSSYPANVLFCLSWGLFLGSVVLCGAFLSSLYAVCGSRWGRTFRWAWGCDSKGRWLCY